MSSAVCDGYGPPAMASPWTPAQPSAATVR